LFPYNASPTKCVGKEAIKMENLLRALLIAVVLLAMAMPLVADSDKKNSPQKTLVERGGYLVTLGGCNDCHTPWQKGPEGPRADMSRMLSGHPAEMELPEPPAPKGSWIWAGAASMTAFSGPWGISFASNLTPHATGMETWTEEEFITAMRTGKHRGNGRPILPPMPWFNLAEATDNDLKAMWAYLRSIPPIDNQVPAPKLNEKAPE
jgi:mono/diheme cytochrome c family protein